MDTHARACGGGDSNPSLATHSKCRPCGFGVGMFGYLVVGAGFARAVLAERLASQASKKVLVVDKRNHIGGNAYDCILLDRHQLDIAKRASVQATVERFSPWAVVNAAGYVRVDDAETDTATCFRDNTSGPVVLADMCAAHDVRLLTLRTKVALPGFNSSGLPRRSPKSMYPAGRAAPRRHCVWWRSGP